MSTNGSHSDQHDAGDELRPDRDMNTHRATVIAAEVRRLERRLRAVGPMPRQKLAETCGADRWREGTFEEAIQEGVRRGTLRHLPLDWIEASSFPHDGQPH
jgi:hypothetical protein